MGRKKIALPWMVALRSINGLERGLVNISSFIRPVPDLQVKT